MGNPAETELVLRDFFIVYKNNFESGFFSSWF